MIKKSSKVERGALIAFVLPTLAIGFMHGPEGQIQGIYATYTGISLGALAGAILLTRMFDAVTYPLIGYLSDRSFTRSGTRRWWIMSGVLLSVFGVWFLYRPPQHVTVFYYTFWMAVTYLGWKVAEIPYQAWSYGLSNDYAQRARIQGWRQMALLFGSMLFFCTPTIAVKLGYSNSPELNLAALGVAAVICAFFLPLASLFALWRVPEAGSTSASASEHKYDLIEAAKSVLSNRAMVKLLMAFVPLSFLTGMSGGVLFLYLNTYLGLSKEYPTIAILAGPMALVGVPFWTYLCMHFERHRVLAVSMTLSALAYAALTLIEPGPAAVRPMMVLYPLITLCTLGIVSVYSMTADAADYGKLQSGEDHTGLYASALMFVVKSLGSVSAAAGIAILGWFGFDAAANVQTASGAFGIKLVVIYAPAAGLGLIAAMIWNYPLTRARLVEIREALAARQESRSSLS